VVTNKTSGSITTGFVFHKIFDFSKWHEINGDEIDLLL
jgi:hypothetical protein